MNSNVPLFVGVALAVIALVLLFNRKRWPGWILCLVAGMLIGTTKDKFLLAISLAGAVAFGLQLALVVQRRSGIAPKAPIT